MSPSTMRLDGLAPAMVWAADTDVESLVVETTAGSFGLLPHRLDGVAALVPGVLTYRTTSAGEMFVAIDEGVLIKTGSRVVVAVRRAVRGADLGALRALVASQFLHQDAEARRTRAALNQVEGGFMRQLARYEQA